MNSYRVSPEELELIHLSEGESHHRIVIIDSVLHDQAVRLGLLVQDGAGQLISGNKEIQYFSSYIFQTYPFFGSAIVSVDKDFSKMQT